METTNEIVIRAPIETVFALAAATEDWPRLLPHYRWVRRLRGDDRRRLVEMAARRDFYPVRWTAIQENVPEQRRITFKHVRGITRGMDVEWRLTETPDGTHVRIWHEFHSHIPLVGEFFAHQIVGRLFVSNIAGKTLRRIKELAEGPNRSPALRAPSVPHTPASADRGEGSGPAEPGDSALPVTDLNDQRLSVSARTSNTRRR